MRDAPAYDQIIQGLSGVMSITGDAESAPLRVGYPVADTHRRASPRPSRSPRALVGRERTGEGAFIDVSMLDSALATMGWVVSNYLIAGRRAARRSATTTSPPRPRAPSGPATACSTSPPTSRSSSRRWSRLIGREDLVADPRFAEREARKRNRAALTAELEAALAAKPAAEWEAHPERGRRPGRPRADACPRRWRSPQVAQRELLADLRRRARRRPARSTVARAGFKLSDGDPDVARAAAAAGRAHRRDAAELGYCAERDRRSCARQGRYERQDAEERLERGASAGGRPRSSTSSPGEIDVRGYPIQDLIGTVSFPR